MKLYGRSLVRVLLVAILMLGVSIVGVVAYMNYSPREVHWQFNVHPNPVFAETTIGYGTPIFGELCSVDLNATEPAGVMRATRCTAFQEDASPFPRLDFPEDPILGHTYMVRITSGTYEDTTNFILAELLIGQGGTYIQTAHFILQLFVYETRI